MLRQQKVNRLAMLIYSTIEIPPLAFHCNRRLVHPPADPDRPLAAMKRLLQLRTVLNDPPIDCGVIPLHPPFLHEFFDVARAQWIRYIPANSHQNDLWGEMRSFETDRHVSLPHVVPLVMERDHTAKGLKEKLATKPYTEHTRHEAIPYNKHGDVSSGADALPARVSLSCWRPARPIQTFGVDPSLGDPIRIIEAPGLAGDGFTLGRIGSKLAHTFRGVCPDGGGTAAQGEGGEDQISLHGHLSSGVGPLPAR